MKIPGQKIKKLITYRHSPNLGDFAILKSDLLAAQMNPDMAVKMQHVVGYHPPIDLDLLITYPPNSFGREYAEHMRCNQLQPLNISPELEEIAQRNVFALRYAVTHDIFHVLLGFDTSYAGEIGVLAFAVAQNYSPSLRIGLGLAKILYPIIAPFQIKAICQNLQIGEKLGKQAEFLLEYRFEEHWDKPTNQVRRDLKLPEIS